MADYLRQVRNDEKRCVFSQVGTLDSRLADGVDPIPLFNIPKNAAVTRVYFVVKEPFAASAEVAVGLSGNDFFGTVALDAAAGTVTISPDSDTIGLNELDAAVSATFNQAAADSTVGVAQIVVEYTEVLVTAGAYTK